MGPRHLGQVEMSILKTRAKSLVEEPTRARFGNGSKTYESRCLRFRRRAPIDAVSEHIGAHLSGVLSGDAAELYTQATRTGQARPDKISKLANFLAKVAKPVASIDLEALQEQLGRGTYSTAGNLRKVNTVLRDGESVVTA